jgi:hypothetical protein
MSHAEALEPRRFLDAAVSRLAAIDFAPTGTLPKTGELIDAGALFGQRVDSGGLSYGWNQDLSRQTRLRTGRAALGVADASLVHLQKQSTPAVWEMAVPNGTYQVTLTAGDPSFTDSVHRISVEGSLAVDFTPTSAQRTVTTTTTVEVRDGRLTVASADGSANAKLLRLDIATVNVGGDTTPPTTPGTLVFQGGGSDWLQFTHGGSTDDSGQPPIYDVYRDNVLVTSVRSLKFRLTGLAAGRGYDVYIRARDAAGNASAPSNVVRALTQAAAPTADEAFYAGASGNDRFYDTVALSDGSVLVSGTTESLSWLPAGTPLTTLDASGIQGQVGGTSIGFLLRLSGDLNTVLNAVALPAGAASEIRHVKLTSRPGDPTGAMYISGATVSNKANGTGYFIARLNNNFVNGSPTAMQWVRNFWVTGDHQTIQPWDVGGDGKVVLATGQPFGADWADVRRLKADGTDDVVPNWRYQIGTNTATGANMEGEYLNAAAAQAAGMNVVRSAIVFKTTGRSQLRSWTQAEYDAVVPDGNGGVRKGTWPHDVFYAGPSSPSAPSSTSPGYTGYRIGANPTQRIGAISVDKRTGAIFIGFSTQSRLPDGNPDFEPTVMAMDSTGALSWWSRLYTEWADNGDGIFQTAEGRLSTPDQYIDRLAIDYANDQLVVGARCHGNNTTNFWAGNAIASQTGESAYQNQWTGSSGNVHISWLGKFSLTPIATSTGNWNSGTLTSATYLAEYEDGMAGTSGTSSDPNMDGWPDPNAGWPNVNTTRIRDLDVDAQGRVYVTSVGRRTITTAGAYQKMVKRVGTGGVIQSSSWNNFVRVYTPNFSKAVYSSILTGTWDLTTGAGGGNVEFGGMTPYADGVLIGGYHQLDTTTGLASGNAMPTAGVPTWGKTTPAKEEGALAWFKLK